MHVFIWFKWKYKGIGRELELVIQFFFTKDIRRWFYIYDILKDNTS